MQGDERAEREDGVDEEPVEVPGLRATSRRPRPRSTAGDDQGSEAARALDPRAHARSGGLLGPGCPLGRTRRIRKRMRKAMASLISLPPGT